MRGMKGDDKFGVFGNANGDNVLRKGALCLVGYLNGGDRRVTVIGMSRSGRLVSIYRDLRLLSNFRVKYIPHRFIYHPDGVRLATDRNNAEQRLTHIIGRREIN